MHRQTDYRGQIAFETDFLYAQRFAYEAIGLALADIIGVATLAAGLACSPTSPATLSAQVAPGRIYSLQNLEPTAWGQANLVGGLAADTNPDHNIIKQGQLRDTTILATPAPVTGGQSINYLIQAAFSETDDGSTVLPFFNASNPATPWAGPGNSGGALPVVRGDHLNLTIKAGTAAATGSQTTPAPDAGFMGLWVVTVANGQATVTSGNISKYSGAVFISETLTQKISQATADARYLQIANARMRLTGNTTYYVSSAGNDSNPGTLAFPWLTLQNGLNWCSSNLDLAGFQLTIQIADGTYAAGLNAFGSLPGQVSPILIQGNLITPSNVALNAGISASQNIVLTANGIKFNTAGSYAISASGGGGINVANCVMAGATLAHFHADIGGTIAVSSNVTVSAGSNYLSLSDNTGGRVLFGSAALTFTGTPVFSQAVLGATQGGVVLWQTSTTSGTVTGPKYLATLNGVISTAGATTPGSSAGSVATGGQFA